MEGPAEAARPIEGLIRVETIEAPSDPVLTVGEVASHLRVTDDDAYLEGVLIPGVTAKVEERFGVALREQKFRQTQDRPMDGIRVPDVWHPPRLEPTYTGSRIKLMRRPVASVEKVAVLDDGGNETVVTNYYVVGEYVVLKSSLPRHRRVGGIQVEFTAGGGISDSVRLDLLRVMADVYDHRGTYVTGVNVARLPDLSGMFAELQEVTV